MGVGRSECGRGLMFFTRLEFLKNVGFTGL